MAKVLLVLTSLVLAAFAEPPVNSNGFSNPSSQYGPPSDAIGGSPAGQFGAERFSKFEKFGSHPVSNDQGYSSSRHSGAAGTGFDSGEPVAANYESKYDVVHQEEGVQFGHEENRQGDVTMGSYYVLLPDGRTQHVEYQVDQDGYKPKISYEEPREGYSIGRPNGGYQSGPATRVSQTQAGHL